MDGDIEKALRVAAEMARRADVAIQRRDRAIRAAHEAGAPLRAIGRAVGTSHNPVRRIIDEGDRAAS
jgi:hypothetical protein